LARRVYKHGAETFACFNSHDNAKYRQARPRFTYWSPK
jgi:hypothetical protein